MSVTVFKRGAVWHYRYQVAGERVQRSTRLRSRARAEEIAQREYDAAVVRANGGEPVPTLAELAHEWLTVKQPVVSAKHYASVETFIRLHAYDLGKKRIGDITTEDVELARNEHLKTHAPSSANHWLRVLKLLTMWAVNRRILKVAPWRVAMIKVQKKPRPILPLGVAKGWFDAIDKASAREPAVGIAVRMMFGLGLRASESSSARWEWIDWQRKTYTPGKTKGREAEPIPMADWLVAYLQPLRKREGLIACKQDGTPFPDGFARTAIQHANAACELKGITPHRLRGTFATLLSESGVPIQSIQKAMRHKVFTTTMAYLEQNMSTVAVASNAIGEKVGFNRRESGAAYATNTNRSGTS